MVNKKIKLGDYCDFTKGNIGITKAIPGEYPLVVTAEKRLSHNEFQLDCKAVIVPLVSSTGHGHASLKRVHYQEGKFSIGTILCALVVKDETIINPRFLYIYLSYFKDHLLVPLMKGAANVTLSISKIKTVEIILPSLERQLEIIELEKNNVLADELNTEITIQKNLLTQLKQSILQEAIQGKLTEDWRAKNSNTEPASELLKRIKAEKAQLIKDKKIKKEKALPAISEEEIPFELPEGWVWCRLGEIILLNSGQDLTTSQYNSKGIGIPYLTGASHIFNNKINVSRWTKTPKSISKKGDLLITCKGTIGKMIFNSIDEIHIARQIMAINIVLDTNIKFIKYFLEEFTNILLKKAKSLIPGISRDDILLITFPLPPVSEQKEIVKKVEQLMAHCQKLEQEITKSETNAQMLMQAVLKEAFSN